jgi:DMSO/TMAO reductase YedYZ molybdopterin-dependent catalytic subunit
VNGSNSEVMKITRRSLFVTGAAALLSQRNQAAGPRLNLITLSPNPKDLETPVEAYIDEITPVEHFFVRSHTMIPQVKLPEWKLEIAGLVEHPIAFKLADLKQFGRVELVSVLECAGNGRSFYRPYVAGAQWRFGSVGNARWTGVRLKDVLEKAAVKPAAKQLLLDGADLPLGNMPKFQRTLEVGKAMHPDTLLAWEMNGTPLTAEHGFPLRVIAPGWASNSWVKWLTRIELLDHDFDGFWMKTAYRHPAQHVAPGTAVDPADMIPVTSLNVKSVIAHPNEWAMPGVITVQGVAWSNASPVSKTEISTDAGKTWSAARFTGKASKYGFRKWVFTWKAAEGQYTLMSRATNEAGQTQPLEPEWNPNGYLYNAAQPRPVQISKTRPPATVATPGAGTQPQPDSYGASCMGCHDDHMMSQQHLTRAQWDREVTKMTGWGAAVKPEQRDSLLDYLSARYKP